MERAPKLVLGAAYVGKDRRQVQEDGSVGQVAASHELFDPIKDHGALGVDVAPIVVGEERAGRETSSEHELAEAVRQPVGDLADIVVREDLEFKYNFLPNDRSL